MEEIKIALAIYRAGSEQKVRVEHTLRLLRLQREKPKEEMTRLT